MLYQVWYSFTVYQTISHFIGHSNNRMLYWFWNSHTIHQATTLHTGPHRTRSNTARRCLLVRMTKGAPSSSTAEEYTSTTAENFIPTTAGTSVMARSAGATAPAKSASDRPSHGYGRCHSITPSDNPSMHLPRRHTVPTTVRSLAQWGPDAAINLSLIIQSRACLPMSPNPRTARISNSVANIAGSIPSRRVALSNCRRNTASLPGEL